MMALQLLVLKRFLETLSTQNFGISLMFPGLTSSGYLLAIGDDNQMYELHPDGNR